MIFVALPSTIFYLARTTAVHPAGPPNLVFHGSWIRSHRSLIHPSRRRRSRSQLDAGAIY
ncbi:hypothetical protein PILCRDRAFT_815552, partial [Piloderma croceum F 1598]